MTSQHDKAKRWQFGIGRLIGSTALFGLTFATMHVFQDEKTKVVVFPTMLGAAVGLLVSGRPGLIVGMLVGWMYAILFYHWTYHS
ncbi:MAG: hypothetical protein CMJ64_09335 [Planctomycetaceae bacterium]|jgi:hypothetical protein|nr:hypothetical protein [Planctomycetaceae bacterium]